MRCLPFLLLLALCVPHTAGSQVLANYRYAPPGQVDNIHLIDVNGGIWALAAHARFGMDSAATELVFGAPSQSPFVGLRLVLDQPLRRLDHLAELGNGVLLGGAQFMLGPTRPYLLHTNALAEPVWSLALDGLTNGQDRIGTILATGSDFTLYTRAEAPETAFFRVNGGDAGQITSSVRYGVQEDAFFQVMDAVGLGNGMEHAVSGTAELEAAPGERSLLIGVLGGTNERLTMYDMGATGAEVENGQAIIHAANGDLVVAGSSSDLLEFSAFVMRTALDGSVIWCKRLFNTGGSLYLRDVIELPGGDVLVCGGNEDQLGILARLTANGDLLWVRRYDPALNGPETFHGFAEIDQDYLHVISEDQVVTLDADLQSCDLQQIASVSVSDHVPAVQELTLAVSNVSLTLDTVPIQTADTQYQLDALCVFENIAEIDGGKHAVAYPNPSDGLFRLVIPDLRSNTEILVFTADGRLIDQLPYSGQLDLRYLPAGPYVISVPALGSRIPVILR
ncbi:MAG: T9SS type A sorting domain-containing protein [Flavobacteriales bacterium]|nr:T9SS type A sorting domain-containing protein [Flavobacteriales bacterium]